MTHPTHPWILVHLLIHLLFPELGKVLVPVPTFEGTLLHFPCHEYQHLFTFSHILHKSRANSKLLRHHKTLSDMFRYVCLCFMLWTHFMMLAWKGNCLFKLQRAFAGLGFPRGCSAAVAHQNHLIDRAVSHVMSWTWTQVLLVGCMDSEMSGFCTCKYWPRSYQLPKKPPGVYRNQARLADWLTGWASWTFFLGTPGNQRRKEPGLAKNARWWMMNDALGPRALIVRAYKQERGWSMDESNKGWHHGRPVVPFSLSLVLTQSREFFVALADRATDEDAAFLHGLWGAEMAGQYCIVASHGYVLSELPLNWKGYK